MLSIAVLVLSIAVLVLVIVAMIIHNPMDACMTEKPYQPSRVLSISV